MEAQKSGGKRQRAKREPVGGIRKRSKDPIDYGITKKQFFTVLEKASQPVKKPESETEKAQI